MADQAVVRVAKPRSEPVELHVLRINMLQVLEIDHVSQKFSARLFFQFRIPNGALDEDLLRDIDDRDAPFPKDTLRPGARWFLQQFDFPTAHDFKIVESKVVVVHPNIDLVFKASGTFFEVMELEHFPVDWQRLTVVLSVSVAKEGICAVRFSNLLADGGSLVATVNNKTFSMR